MITAVVDKKPVIKSIKDFKDEYDLTAKAIAEIAGVSHRTVEGWLLGRPIPEASVFKLWIWEKERFIKDLYSA